MENDIEHIPYYDFIYGISNGITPPQNKTIDAEHDDELSEGDVNLD